MSSSSIITLFREAVRIRSEEAAIQLGDQVIKYCELEAQSNVIANALLEMKVPRGSLIAIVANHRANVIRSILGVLKSGCIFAPLDPGVPSERLRLNLSRLEPVAVILEADLKDCMRSVLEGISHELLLVSKYDGSTAMCFVQGQQVENSSALFAEREPAEGSYVFLTSGSTGKPKAILGCMKGVLHFVNWEISTFRLGVHTRVSQLTSPIFDAFLRDMFTPLCAGGTICVPSSRDGILDPGSLVNWIGKANVDLVHCVPSLFRIILQAELSSEHFPNLKNVLLSGEVLHGSDVGRWMDLFGNRVQLVNLYGPTETTMTKFVHFITRDDAYRRKVPIGKPMEGARAILLDEDGNVTARGHVGEIYIRTPYRTLGYLNDQALTAEVFVPNPLNPGDATDVVYRTGDLGRILVDGLFEFVGRKDFQVKVRGIRIEPSEIEGILREYPTVADVAVVLQDDLNGEPHLCAYVVIREPTALDEIRKFAADRLPDYLIPRILALDTLPRLESGKLDRKALAALIDSRDASDRPLIPPRNSVEAILKTIWERVLGVAEVSMDDEYFDLGGNSLQAVRLIAEVNRVFGMSLSLATLLEGRTISGLARVIANSVSSKVTVSDLPLITPDPESNGKPFPLTDVQQAYWVGRTGAIELGNVATHTYIEFEAKDLNRERFACAWQRLIQRHDMLRAIILPDGQQQILNDVPRYTPVLLDLRGRAEVRLQKEIDAIRSEMSHQVLPTDRWPLFDIRLTLLDNDYTRIHVSYDLLISDAFSNAILAREFAHYYHHPNEELEPLAITFRDYVLHDLALRNSSLYTWSKDYWLKRLDDLPPAPDLPLIKQVSQLKFPRFAHQIHRLEKECWERVKKRAASVGLTASGLLIAVMAEVLSCWSKSKHYCVNVTLFNRLPMHPEVNRLVGDFTSVTILEVDHRIGDTFSGRARRLQHQLWQDLDHRYFSGVQLIRELTRRMSGTRKALYPVVFTSTLVHGSLRQGTSTLLEGARQMYRSSQTSQVWLDNVAVEENGSVILRWNAVEELFPEGMLHDMFQAYCQLLQRLADDTEIWDQPVDLIPMYQRVRRRETNRTDGPLPSGLLQDRFCSCVRLNPDHMAVTGPTGRLTYAELDQLSTVIGSRLRVFGAKPNTPVAIVMEKGWEQIVAVLGTLKAGAAYLPIDASLPKSRLWYLLENSQTHLVLTQAFVNARLEWPTWVERICVDRQERLERIPKWESVQQPSDLAYVMYTSGSTGLPKGVMISHEAVINRVLDVNQRFSVSEKDRGFALTALHHDLSVYDIFGYLLAGGTIVLPDPARLRDPTSWIALIETERVTCWNSVPAYLEMLMDVAEASAQVPAAELSSLRLILMSGDWIPISLPSRIRLHCPSAEMISLGGPTEVTIWDVCFPITTADPEWRSIPYGKPMLNNRVYILDDTLLSRPDWVPGEIYSAGIGLARGYWQDEAKTKDRFLAHPDTGERLFRTGDLGRYLPDDNIEFLGRTDSQVKIQGWRIELGEIESTLLQHPAVNNAAVTTIDAGGRRRLVAFVVPKQKAMSPDEVDSSSPAWNPLERLRFKLKKLGLRKNSELPFIDLGRPPDSEPLREQFVKRRSYRSFERTLIPLCNFGNFLSPIMQMQLEGLPLPKFRYASAGGLYPVQVYIYVKASRIDDLGAGAYYYNPVAHRLELLSAQAEITAVDYHQANRSLFDDSAFCLFFVAELAAIRPIYAEKSRDFCMIEAGLMTHLLESEAADRGIGLCHVGGVDFGNFAHWFQLKETHEYLYGLVGGAISQRQVTLAGLIDDSTELVAAVAAAHDDSSTAAKSVTWSVDRLLADSLRTYLQARLPEYMIPASYQFVEAFPLSPNGKVNRQALALMEEVENPPISSFQQLPLSETERKITRIWCEVLGLTDVGASDNFFDIGGNSVHLIRVHLKLKQTFDTRVPIVEMFRHPTVRDLARLVSGHSERNDESGTIADRAQRQRNAFASQKQRMT